MSLCTESEATGSDNQLISISLTAPRCDWLVTQSAVEYSDARVAWNHSHGSTHSSGDHAIDRCGLKLCSKSLRQCVGNGGLLKSSANCGKLCRAIMPPQPRAINSVLAQRSTDYSDYRSCDPVLYPADICHALSSSCILLTFPSSYVVNSSMLRTKEIS